MHNVDGWLHRGAGWWGRPQSRRTDEGVGMTLGSWHVDGQCRRRQRHSVGSRAWIRALVLFCQMGNDSRAEKNLVAKL
jgi:hypothetical protein